MARRRAGLVLLCVALAGCHSAPSNAHACATLKRRYEQAPAAQRKAILDAYIARLCDVPS